MAMLSSGRVKILILMGKSQVNEGSLKSGYTGDPKNNCKFLKGL